MTVIILSKGVFHRTAAIIPKGTPTSQVNRITIVVNNKVFGILSPNFALTFSPVEVTPKSPVTNDIAHLPYWTIIGLTT